MSALKKVKKVTPLKRPEKPNTFNALHNLIKSGLSKSKKKEAMADVDKSVSPIQKYRDFNMRNSKVLLLECLLGADRAERSDSPIGSACPPDSWTRKMWSAGSS